MKKLLKWIKKHARPHYKYIYPPDNICDINKPNRGKIDDFKENSEIGIKITFKF